MSSSPEALRLTAEPVGLRVAADGPIAALERLAAESAERRAERAAAAAAAETRERLAAPFEALAAGLDAERERLGAELVQSAITLGLTVARELIRNEIDRDRHGIEAVVRQCLAEANVGRQPMRVALHPDDLARLEGVRFSAGVELQSDPGVRKGDALVESSIGLLVRNVDEALENVERALRAELRNEPEEASS